MNKKNDHRTTKLLRAAVEALEDGRDPLDIEFLNEHGVTLDEAYALADQLAVGARILIWAIENPEHARGALNGAHTVAVYKALNKALAALPR